MYGYFRGKAVIRIWEQTKIKRLVLASNPINSGKDGFLNPFQLYGRRGKDLLH
jgi:hypothetical protein